MRAEYASQAKKAISRMDAVTKNRIRQGIAQIPGGDIQALKGAAGTYRLRVGGWRVLYSYLDSDKILIEKIGPRGQIYKGV